MDSSTIGFVEVLRRSDCLGDSTEKFAFRYESYIVADMQSFPKMNNMELNPGKCKDTIVDFLHFITSVLKPIVIGATHVKTVSSFKLLGVYITTDLTWSVQCLHIIKKSNRRLYALRKLQKSGIASSDILLVYCTIIR